MSALDRLRARLGFLDGPTPGTDKADKNAYDQLDTGLGETEGANAQPELNIVSFVGPVPRFVTNSGPASDPFLISVCDGGPIYAPLNLPALDAPLGKCRGCTFIAQMSPRQLCGKCEVERQTRRAGDP